MSDSSEINETELHGEWQRNAQLLLMSTRILSIFDKTMVLIPGPHMSQVSDRKAKKIMKGDIFLNLH